MIRCSCTASPPTHTRIMVYLYCLLVCCSCTCTSPHTYTHFGLGLQAARFSPKPRSGLSGVRVQSELDVGLGALAKATYAINYFVRLHGHRGSFTGARQLVGHKGGVFKRLFDRNFYFMAKKHARCAKCACAADATSEMQVRSTPATAPQMVPQRYSGRRTCRTARNRRCLCRFQLQSTKMLQTAHFYLRT